MRRFLSLYLLLTTALFSQAKDSLMTDYEASGYLRSPRHAQTVDYCRRLVKASPWMHYRRFGTSPQGRDLPLLIFSTDRAFTAQAARRTGKPVIMIQSGIHSGEIDGKDASFLLLRDLIRGPLRDLASEAILLVIPIFNVDGHERQSPYNRINQNGPEEMGWRTTAANLNLNRDYLKADAPEMRSWLTLFNEWLPDLVVDIHVTDGIDFQYNLTYSMEMYANAPETVVRWQRGFETFAAREMQRSGDPIIPYVFLREDQDLSRGLITSAAPPRFSTGYVAIRNRAALLVETHMLKPYKARVTAVRNLLEHLLRYLRQERGALRTAVRLADQETERQFLSTPPSSFPLRFAPGDSSQPITFLGYEVEMQPGIISGKPWPRWRHDRPTTVTIPLFNSSRVTQSVLPPRAYIIPREFTEVLSILRLHGVRLHRFTRECRAEVETLVFSDPRWQATPYEGRRPLRVATHARRDTILVPAGSYAVLLNQPSAKAAIHLLEPEAPDSFVSWGFFDAFFEQKEYFEPWVMEEKARAMMDADSSLASAFRHRLASDSAFAANPRARLQYFYERSHWFDAQYMVYPIQRLLIPLDPPLAAEPPRR